MTTYTPACRRCHMRKIKCDTNRPSCRPCTDANVPCQPHERQRRFPSQRIGDDARRRLAWLEDGLSTQLGVDLRAVKTGTHLGDRLRGLQGRSSKRPSPDDHTTDDSSQSKSILKEDDSGELSMDVAADISLLTLNATGEMRYIGPSSGSFFAKYASNFARGFLSEETKKALPLAIQCANTCIPMERLLALAEESALEITRLLTPKIAKYLLDCYSKWVHPLFPLLDQSYLRGVLEPLCFGQGNRNDSLSPSPDSQMCVIIMYHLVLALGAVHVLPNEDDSEEQACYLEFQEAVSSKKISQGAIFVKALDLLDSTSQAMQPSIALIQIILLICIYGGYKPSGNRQWQLSGIAIRTSVEIGLHRHRENWKFNPAELDLRRRVFWNAYAIELTAAFNLGRPPSIADEHIDAPFPGETADTAMALHIIRLRQLQSKILTQIYCAPGRLKGLTNAEKNHIIYRLQSEVDEWRDTLIIIYSRYSPIYPLQYCERLYYCTVSSIHRPTPLFPQPSIESASKSLRAAGQFIDIHHYLLKSTNVPQSWMLLQGTLLFGITILVTARANAPLLLKRDDFSVFEIMEWNRKCSLVLTIMGERWSEKSLSKLEAKFSLLANDTLRMLLAVKENPGLKESPQLHKQQQNLVSGGTSDSSSYGTPVAQVDHQPHVGQNGDWTYHNPYPTLPVSMDFASQNYMGFSNFPPFGNVMPGDAGGGGGPEACPLEGFFGSDDLFSFWEVLPATNEPMLHFGP